MRWTPQARHEKPKKYTRSLDDETIKKIGQYYKVDGKNFESLIKYIKSRGLPEDAA
ncbi:MAG TPA: hypothetical protein VJ742_04295 [Nitrososphaera sp.]|jgi:hypothetical protein|nr:hypothetical protein [Nitrososphaera sp.]